MATTEGLGQAYVDAQKSILDAIVSADNYHVTLELAQAFNALVERPPRNADPRERVAD